MSRAARYAVAATATAVLVATLAGCGESADPEAGSTPSETPSASPSTSPSPSSAAQPQGEHGVTVTIENWSDYAKNPVVLDYKKTLEAFLGSANAREPNADFLRRTAKEQRRMWVFNINYARENDLVAAGQVKVRIERVKTSGKTATLVACDLRETSNFRPRGEKYAGDERGWHRMRNTFELRGDLWVMTKSEPRGRCQKGA